MNRITLPRAVIEQALKALQSNKANWPEKTNAITALRAALAQQAEPVEPVAWLWKIKAVDTGPHTQQLYFFSGDGKPWSDGWTWTPLYTAPPQRKPLTDEEIRDLWSWSMTAEAERTATTQQHAFTRAIERAHGIGEKK